MFVSPGALKMGSMTVKHILLVEDEEHLAKGIRFNLEEEGYRVTVAGDGATAVQCFEEERDAVDLIVLDLMLPRMSGYAICERIRSDGSNVPILILSARTLSEDRTRGFDVGANQYLTKPFELDELLSRVKNLLRTHGSQAPPTPITEGPDDVESFGRAIINFRTHEVSVDGESVKLTQLELKVMRYFLENEERVIDRAELLENVWGMPGQVTTRAVDQFIARLRKIFEIDPSSPSHFLTVRDAGYRFVR
jgi:two-component system OmpR family response regulator